MPDALALWHALCAGTGRHLLGLPGFWQRQTVSPKSWIPGRKLRISNCSPESQKKEQVSPPGCLRKYFTCLQGRYFSDVFFLASVNLSFTRTPGGETCSAWVLLEIFYVSAGQIFFRCILSGIWLIYHLPGHQAEKLVPPGCGRINLRLTAGCGS